jgi:hypothetical protein
MFLTQSRKGAEKLLVRPHPDLLPGEKEQRSCGISYFIAIPLSPISVLASEDLRFA